MKYDAKIDITERINKKGQPYKMFEVWMTTQHGEFVKIYERFCDDVLYTLITVLKEDRKTK